MSNITDNMLGGKCSKCGHCHMSIVCHCGCDISGELLRVNPAVRPQEQASQPVANLLENADVLEVFQKYAPRETKGVGLQTLSQITGALNDVLTRQQASQPVRELVAELHQVACECDNEENGSAISNIADRLAALAATPTQPPIKRCQVRHPEGGQCELKLGHKSNRHLAGMILWACPTCGGEGSIGQADEGTLAACPDCATTPTQPIQIADLLPILGNYERDTACMGGISAASNLCDALNKLLATPTLRVQAHRAADEIEKRKDSAAENIAFAKGFNSGYAKGSIDAAPGARAAKNQVSGEKESPSTQPQRNAGEGYSSGWFDMDDGPVGD